MPLPAISAGCAGATRPKRKPLLAAGVVELAAAGGLSDSPATVAGSAMLERVFAPLLVPGKPGVSSCGMMSQKGCRGGMWMVRGGKK